MHREKMWLKLILVLLILAGFREICAAEELIQVPAVIHISSTVSDGKLSIPEIVRIARGEGAKVVMFTDHDYVNWEYGLWPLRKIIKKKIARKSVSTYGIKKYLQEIEAAQKENPDMVLIPGVESAPFYYWEGSPFKKTLKLHNWHKHILAIGLEKTSDYRNLPLVSNKRGLYKNFNILLFWPLAAIFFGLRVIKKRKFNYKDFYGRELGECSLKWRFLGIILIIFGLLFLINNFPFKELKYDQYHGDQGAVPYQEFINYVIKKGGLTFCAHPEAKYSREIKAVEVITGEYCQDLLKWGNYTGYSIFSEGYKKTGCPSGIWDEALKQYCTGKRTTPVWAIGELDFDSNGELSEYISDLSTILLVPQLNKQAVLKALKNGNFYVVRGNGNSKLLLHSFTVGDTPALKTASLGGEIKIKDCPQIKISGSLTGGQNLPAEVEIKLIRNGEIIKTFITGNIFEVDYKDNYFAAGEKAYYRLEICSGGKVLITNPVFAEFLSF